MAAPDFITGIKARSRWIGQIQQMNSIEVAKRLMENTPIEKREVVRPRYRWMDGMLENIQRLLTGGWLLGIESLKETLKGGLEPTWVVEPDMMMIHHYCFKNLKLMIQQRNNDLNSHNQNNIFYNAIYK